MKLEEIRLIYLRELRAAARERDILINAVLVPLLLYPLVLWLIFSTVTFLRGQEERFTSRIALVGFAADHQLYRNLAANERIELVELSAMDDAAALVRSGELDAVGERLAAASEAVALAGNFRLRVMYDASEDRSQKAQERLVSTLEGFRETWIDQHTQALGIDARSWTTFRFERSNVSSGQATGAFLLGLIAPLLMVIMVAVGCYYPAIDTTAGERERSTWETLMTVAASRTSILVGKYLYVATVGALAGLLNLLGLALSLGAVLRPLLAGAEEQVQFAIPYAALPFLMIAMVLLALFVAAGMMLFAAFARTFKEGQSMVGPFYLICLLPPLLVQSPDLELTPSLALVPIANLTLVFRAAIVGTYNWPLIALSFAVELAAITLCLMLARRVLAFEDVMIGSYNGSLGNLIRQRLLGGHNRKAKES